LAFWCSQEWAARNEPTRIVRNERQKELEAAETQLKQAKDDMREMQVRLKVVRERVAQREQEAVDLDSAAVIAAQAGSMSEVERVQLQSSIARMK
jgi:predicted  nucleic acid-binding Zn-ribbon protein